MSVTSTYTVSGMTCQHCVQSVTEEVSEVAGVTDVQVELATGQVTVTSDVPVESATIGAAITEAGYEMAS